MSETNAVFSCSTVEAVYLAALLGAKNLVGFPDPFFGWLTEEVEPQLNAARDGLAARGVLELHADGSATLHDPAAAIFSGCIAARGSLLLTFSAGSQLRQINYHLTAGETVVHRPTADLSTHELWLSGDSEGLLADVMDFFPVAEQVPPSVQQGGAVPEPALAKARQLAAESGAVAAGALLEQAGFPSEAAVALATSLADPAWNGSIVGVVRQQPEWDVEGTAFLAGAGGFWQLRTVARGGASWVEARPCSPEQASEELRSVLRQVLSAPVAG